MFVIKDGREISVIFHTVLMVVDMVIVRMLKYVNVLMDGMTQIPHLIVISIIALNTVIIVWIVMKTNALNVKKVFSWIQPLRNAETVLQLIKDCVLNVMKLSVWNVSGLIELTQIPCSVKTLA